MSPSRTTLSGALLDDVDDLEDELDGLDTPEEDDETDSAPPPPPRRSSPRARPNRDEEILALLRQGPKTTNELVDGLGLPRTNSSPARRASPVVRDDEILKSLANGPLLTSELLERLNVTASAKSRQWLRRAMGRLAGRVTGELASKAEGYRWSLAKASPPKPPPPPAPTKHPAPIPVVEAPAPVREWAAPPGLQFTIDGRPISVDQIIALVRAARGIV